MNQHKPQLSSAQCKAKAAECLGFADATSRSSHRIMLQHMADTWERIAANIEELGEPRAVSA